MTYILTLLATNLAAGKRDAVTYRGDGFYWTAEMRDVPYVAGSTTRYPKLTELRPVAWSSLTPWLRSALARATLEVVA